KVRAWFMKQFGSVASIAEDLPSPHDPMTFEKCKRDHSEREKHSEALALHRDLLRLRKQLEPTAVDGAVIGENAFLLRFGDDRLLLVNLGPDLGLDVAPEPLLAPPGNCRWTLRWWSEAKEYGG